MAKEEDPNLFLDYLKHPRTSEVEQLIGPSISFALYI